MRDSINSKEFSQRRPHRRGQERTRRWGRRPRRKGCTRCLAPEYPRPRLQPTRTGTGGRHHRRYFSYRESIATASANTSSNKGHLSQYPWRENNKEHGTAPKRPRHPIPTNRTDACPSLNRWSSVKRARASDVVDKPEESTAQVSRKTRTKQPKADKNRASDAVHDSADRGLWSKTHNTRQRKVYKLERGSRRLAGRLPEYSMFPKQGEPAPPYEPPSNIRKPNPSGPRTRASSKKKSIAVKGAKPRGSSKSGREGTNRPKTSKKGSEGWEHTSLMVVWHRFASMHSFLRIVRLFGRAIASGYGKMPSPMSGLRHPAKSS